MDVQTASKLARFARHILRRISDMESAGEDARAWRGVFHQLVQLIKKLWLAKSLLTALRN